VTDPDRPRWRVLHDEDIPAEQTHEYEDPDPLHRCVGELIEEVRDELEGGRLSGPTAG
jgi:hypothetical protein